MEIIDITQYSQEKSLRIPIVLQESRVEAGFPSPADDYKERSLDINDYLIDHPEATYFVKVSGNSMIEAGILDGDILVVDRMLDAVHNKIIIAEIDNQFTVKRLYKKNGVIKLVAENKEYPDITMTDQAQLNVWGVVVGCIRKFS